MGSVWHFVLSLTVLCAHGAAGLQSSEGASSESSSELRSNTKLGKPKTPPYYYFDAANMPPWLTPPWVTHQFRTGPLAMPAQRDLSDKGNQMFRGVPPMPLLPFDPQTPLDAKKAAGAAGAGDGDGDGDGAEAAAEETAAAEVPDEFLQVGTQTMPPQYHNRQYAPGHYAYVPWANHYGQPVWPYYQYGAPAYGYGYGYGYHHPPLYYPQGQYRYY